MTPEPEWLESLRAAQRLSDAGVVLCDDPMEVPFVLGAKGVDLRANTPTSYLMRYAEGAIEEVHLRRPPKARANARRETASAPRKVETASADPLALLEAQTGPFHFCRSISAVGDTWVRVVVDPFATCRFSDPTAMRSAMLLGELRLHRWRSANLRLPSFGSTALSYVLGFAANSTEERVEVRLIAGAWSLVVEPSRVDDRECLRIDLVQVSAPFVDVEIVGHRQRLVEMQVILPRMVADPAATVFDPWTEDADLVGTDAADKAVDRVAHSASKKSGDAVAPAVQAKASQA